MAVTIKKVESRSDLKKFVGFPLKLYKGSKTYVPGMFNDDMDTFTPAKNPVYSFCKTALFLAYKDDKLVGRIAGIINSKANERWDHKEIRCGWFDFIDDKEVSKALLDAVVEYGRQNGMNKLTGPLGFVDFDAEGLLVEGYEYISSYCMRHNYLYYKDHYEAYGFHKDVDWLEYKIYVPKEVPEKYVKMSRLVSERFNLHVRHVTMKEIKKEKMGQKIFALVNEAYGQLYDYTPMPNDLIDHYINNFLGLLDLKFVSVICNEKDEIVGVGVTMPSITRAMQKCHGKMFPFGWYHLLKSMYFKYEESFELLIIGVTDEYRNKGVHAMIFNDLFPKVIKAGFKWAETNAELETNHNIQALWDGFDYEQVKRRRAYTMDI